jgi:hypothetical protein
MSRERISLDNIKIAAPCKADWRFMYGNERVRFCGQCSKNVYNLSALTREQAEDLILRNEGNLCVRFYRRKDGTIILNNCPVGLRAIKARYNSTKATILKAAMTFLAYIGVLWWVEGKPANRPVTGRMVATGEVVPVMGGFALPPPSAPRLIKRSEAYIREQAVYKVMPVAHTNGVKLLKGDVVVQVIISPEGEVERATFIKGLGSVKDIAEGAALRWKFAPMTEGGNPVRVESSLTFRFDSILPAGMNRFPAEDKQACEECL